MNKTNHLKLYLYKHLNDRFNMRLIQILPLLFLFFSCTEQETILETETSRRTENIKEIESSAFQTLLDSADLRGAILVYDLEADQYHSNNYEWAKAGHLPASTYKIPNSIIGLETGVAEDDSTIFEWDGEPKMFARWEQDLIFKDAFHYSCVPCYQDLARNIGVKAMNEHLTKFEYGNKLIDSNDLDLFWLQGDFEISQFGQINFLKKLYLSELPISDRTEKIIKRMIVIDQEEDYVLRGKTGWSRQNDIDNGWFVGYIEVDGQVYFFATNIEPENNAEFDVNAFLSVRMDITLDALRELQII